jgi:hypothetical protein
MLIIIRMEPYQVARIGTTASHFSALVYSLVWISNDEVPSVATLLSFGLVYLGEWTKSRHFSCFFSIQIQKQIRILFFVSQAR